MDEELLISEVEKHRIIYDSTHPFYKDTVKKDNTWTSISARLGVDGELITCKYLQYYTFYNQLNSISLIRCYIKLLL